jgi:16S rRNA processing protein RimM
MTRKKNPANSDYLILGRLGASHGVRGWLHLNSFTDPIDNIFQYKQWQVKHRGQWQPVEVTQGKVQGNRLVVKLKGIDNRELASEYTNDEIAVSQEALPELSEDEYYWQDLIGATVTTQSGINLGIVKSLMTTGSNDVFVVQGERERLIPYTDDVVIHIDKKAQQITVNWDPEF